MWCWTCRELRTIASVSHSGERRVTSDHFCCLLVQMNFRALADVLGHVQEEFNETRHKAIA